RRTRHPPTWGKAEDPSLPFQRDNFLNDGMFSSLDKRDHADVDEHPNTKQHNGRLNRKHTGDDPDTDIGGEQRKERVFTQAKLCDENTTDDESATEDGPQHTPHLNRN